MAKHGIEKVERVAKCFTAACVIVVAGVIKRIGTGQLGNMALNARDKQDRDKDNEM